LSYLSNGRVPSPFLFEIMYLELPLKSSIVLYYIGLGVSGLIGLNLVSLFITDILTVLCLLRFGLPLLGVIYKD